MAGFPTAGGGVVEARSVTRSTLPSSLFGDGMGDAQDPAALSPRAALGISAVWGCARVLASAVATLPLHTYRDGTDGVRQRADDAQLARLLARPAPTMTTGDLLGQIMLSLLTDGSAFAALATDATGRVVQLVVLPPTQVEVRAENGRLWFVYMNDSGVHRLEPEDVVMIRSHMQLPGGLRGLSPLRFAAASMGEARALSRSGQAFAKRAGRPGMAVVMDKDVHAQQPAREALRQELDARYEGTDNAGRSIILGGGVQSIEELRLSSVDADFVRHRNLSVSEVCRIYGVPEHLVAAPTGDSQTYSTVEGRATDFLRWSLEPHLRVIETAFTNHPVARGLTVEFARDAMLRPTSEARATVYSQAISSGWLTVDEVRALENRPPLPAKPTGVTL